MAEPSVQLVLMGVTACGKTTVGEALRDKHGWAFVDSDSLHSQANKVKMAAGHPLSDEDRWPWLEAVAKQLRGWSDAGIAGSIACSALKLAYRDLLRDRAPQLGLVYLHCSRELSLSRVEHRKGHFMPASLVDSQFADLQEPLPRERALVLQADASLDENVAAVVRHFKHAL